MISNTERSNAGATTLASTGPEVREAREDAPAAPTLRPDGDRYGLRAFVALAPPPNNGLKQTRISLRSTRAA